MCYFFHFFIREPRLEAGAAQRSSLLIPLEKRGDCHSHRDQPPGKSWATGGLDRRANYLIINDYTGAAAMGRGVAGKTPGNGEAGGGSGENLSEKLLTFATRPHTLIKLKFGQFWPRHMGGASRRSSKVERLICNQGVAGSSPIAGSREALFFIRERYPSGQRGRAVNPLAQPTEVRILPSPPPPLQVAGIAQWPERQPSKLRVAGSSPVSRST